MTSRLLFLYKNPQMHKPFSFDWRKTESYSQFENSLKELSFVRIDCNCLIGSFVVLFRTVCLCFLKLFAKKNLNMALLKKGVYSSVILPDEDKHTKKYICRMWHLGKWPGKRCTTMNDSFFFLPLCGKAKCVRDNGEIGKNTPYRVFLRGENYFFRQESFKTYT